MHAARNLARSQQTLLSVSVGARAIVLALAAGCGAEPLATELASDAPLAQQRGPGLTFAEVVPNGTGCPRGTAFTEISSDGLVFNTTFSSFLSEVVPNTSAAVSECVLAIKLHSPRGRSYAVQTFAYTGYANLEAGVSARQTVAYSFQGRPLPANDSNRTELLGPHDASFVFRDDIDVRDRVWSPCGVERDLNVTTRLQVQNTADLQSVGYMSLSTVDGSTSQVMVQLEERDCDVGAVPVAPPMRDGGLPAPQPTQALDAGASDAGLPPITKPTSVRVLPSVVRRDQVFSVAWEAGDLGGPTRYAVEVRFPLERGGAVLWRSPFTESSPIVYAGPSFPAAGLYPVAVIAQTGSAEVRSDPALLSVRADAFADPPPSVDAGVPDAGAPDAGEMPPSPAQGALPPVGRYGARSYSFWLNPRGSVLSVKELAIAEVEETPSGRQLSLRLCAQRSSTPGMTLDLVKPAAYPLLRRPLRATAEGWATDAAPVGTGFDHAGVAQCSGRPGQEVPKRASQSWIRGSTCRCPTSPDQPPTLTDCRINDADGDGMPGLAYRQAGRFGVTLHLATVQRTHHLRGRVEPGGVLFANQRVDESSYQLACTPSGCPNLAEVPRPCTADNNGTELVPLPPQVDWNCATLLANEGQLFPRPVPAAPRTCTRDALTDAP